MAVRIGAHQTVASFVVPRGKYGVIEWIPAGAIGISGRIWFHDGSDPTVQGTVPPSGPILQGMLRGCFYPVIEEEV